MSIVQSLCECCHDIANQGETLCDGCKTDSFLMQYIHERPEGTPKPESQSVLDAW